MAIRFPSVLRPRRAVSYTDRTASRCLLVPKGYTAIYVGESEMKRFIIPVSFLNDPLFQDLLSKAEEEFGYDHPMGCLTIPCTEESFIDVTSSLCRS